MNEDKERLRHLLEHWVEHNKSHRESFKDWLTKSEKMGLNSVAKKLKEAVDANDEVIKSLQRALKEIK